MYYHTCESKKKRACYFRKNPVVYSTQVSKYIHILYYYSNSKTRGRRAAASKVTVEVVGDGGREEVQQTVDSHGPNDMNLQLLLDLGSSISTFTYSTKTSVLGLLVLL